MSWIRRKGTQRLGSLAKVPFDKHLGCSTSIYLFFFFFSTENSLLKQVPSVCPQWHREAWAVLCMADQKVWQSKQLSHCRTGVSTSHILLGPSDSSGLYFQSTFSHFKVCLHTFFQSSQQPNGGNSLCVKMSSELVLFPVQSCEHEGRKPPKLDVNKNNNNNNTLPSLYSLFGTLSFPLSFYMLPS